MQLISAAAVIGVCLHFFYSSFVPTSPVDQHNFDPNLGGGILRVDPDVTKQPPTPMPTCTEAPKHDLTKPPVEPEPGEPLDRLEYLRNMVSKTKGYYVRDWSLGLGWNNVRG